MAYVDNTETQKADREYIRNSMNAPILEKDKELALARAWRDNRDEKALHELVSAYTRLVVSIANKFRFYGLPIGDLIQEGNIGLMTAAEKFEPDRDLRFSTYANWWIKSCIQDYVLRNWSIVRTGTTAAHKSLFFNFRRLRAQIEGTNEHEGLSEADRAQIAEDLGVRIEHVEHMEGRLSGVDSSLNATIADEDNGAQWQDTLAEDAPNPEEVVTSMRDAQTRSKWLNDALHTLPSREQTIISQRHLSDDVVTLEQLGQDLGISKERVRQLEQRAMDTLKTAIYKAKDTEIKQRKNSAEHLSAA
ncbi:MAG TPA: RNA polymerase factor sigma-32 [Rhodospirillaceae bacterium]|nr:RNA polymerase factor sigma-32 [Rhodospirillaceae bacterium]